MPFQRSHLLNLIFLTIPNFNPIIKEHQNLFIILAFFSVDETARDEEKDIRTFTIWGGGYGHGVGMSQNGAQEMAREGKNYEEILMSFSTSLAVSSTEKKALGSVLHPVSSVPSFFL